MRGQDFLRAKLFQELGTNLKKMEQNSKEKVQNCPVAAPDGYIFLYDRQEIYA